MRIKLSTLLLASLSGALLLACTGCRSTAPARPNAALPASFDENDEAYKQIKLLTRALVEIRKEYVDESKISYTNLIYGAIQGMMETLDQYSQFLEPDRYQELKDDTSGEFGGVGIFIGMKDNSLTVIAPMEDTPAYRAGILAGDRIVEINGIKTAGLGLGEAIKKLRGEKGTKVALKVLRPKTGEVKEYPITREQIKITTVKGTRMLDNRIGYIRLVQFSEPTAAALHVALTNLTHQNMKALILDLRNNPGGLLSSAVEVSELFLKNGDLIVLTKGRGLLENQPAAKAGGKFHYLDFPMAILVNNGTASAAEIVSGALQDHKRAVLIGELTFGKGSVQSLLPLDDGAALRLTTAKYYTPSQRVIHEKGIEPDVVVPMTSEEWQKVLLKRGRTENPELFAEDNTDPKLLANAVDRQLERAMDLLKGILIFQTGK